MVFPKKMRWNIIFLVLSENMVFLFPENMILHLRRKMKDDLFQKKNTRKYDIFFKPFEKMVFPKRATPTHDLSCLIWKDDIFPPKTVAFLGITWKYDIFSVHVRVLQTWRHAPLSKKNRIWSFPPKIHLKVIEILDWHPRKSSSNSLYFHGDLCRRFDALLSSEKTNKQET